MMAMIIGIECQYHTNYPAITLFTSGLESFKSRYLKLLTQVSVVKNNKNMSF